MRARAQCTAPRLGSLHGRPKPAVGAVVAGSMMAPQVGASRCRWARLAAPGGASLTGGAPRRPRISGTEPPPFAPITRHIA